jgi:hypothetical protein
MSSISSLSSTASPYQTTSQNGPGQLIQDFNAIGSALQSGDLSSAQSALTTFQQNLQGDSQTSSTGPFGQNSQANTDYQNLTTALKSGDLSGAQKAFASLKQDVSGAGAKAHRGHHHHRSGGASETASTDLASSNSSTTSTSSETGITGISNALLNTTA